jgi:hypothetical protein
VLEEQRVSFIYGNAPKGSRITKESARKAAKSRRLMHGLTALSRGRPAFPGPLVDMLVLEHRDRDLYNRVQEQKLSRQYDLLMDCIKIGLQRITPISISICFGPWTTWP